MPHPNKPTNTFSATEAANYLHLSYKYIYTHMQLGHIKYQTYQVKNSTYKVIPAKEVKRIQKLIAPPKFAITIQDLAQYMHYDPTLLYSLVKKLRIKPLIKRSTETANQIGPRKTYYRQIDLLPIYQHLHKQKGHLKYQRYGKNHIFHLNTNTTTIYDPNIHFSIVDLLKQLNPHKTPNINMLHQWLIWGHLKNYNVDINNKLYFTKAQVNQIQKQYLNHDQKSYLNNRQLAKKIGIDPSQLIHFRNFYQIKTFTVLGDNHVFYTPENAKKLINWWHHPEQRPYPYHYRNPKL